MTQKFRKKPVVIDAEKFYSRSLDHPEGVCSCPDGKNGNGLSGLHYPNH